MNSKKRIAIVTGASAGLGVEYAREAENQFNLDEIWLVARRPEPMKKLAGELKRAKGIVIALDLARREECEKLAARIRAESPEIVLLVNNAGCGKVGRFESIDLAAQLGEIDVNITALTLLTHAALPYMGKNSFLLQVASSIGFCPAPLMAVYAATKAYVLSFTHALREECRGRGIGITAVCPGPVATEFLDVALPPGTLRKGTRVHLAATARQVVELSYYDLKAGRALSICGWTVRAFALAARVLPASWMAWLVGKRP